MNTLLQQKYEALIVPSGDLVNDMARLEGDILILGAGGKMGPALSKLAVDAIEKAGISKTVTAVARYSEAGLQQEMERHGIKTIVADLLDDRQLESLPQAKNIIYMAGMKFGTTGNESLTWAMNSYLPGRVAEKFKHSRIVAFSTGNVYPLIPVVMGGATEDLPAAPVGEYAQSCLGRERMFQFAAKKNNTPVLIYRLNYANDVTYGVLVDIAKSVRAGVPVDLRTGCVNVIWQKDANEIALRCLHHCTVPAKILNVTGPEILSVRWIAEEFGRIFNKKPEFINQEENTALLGNAAESFRLFGYPKLSAKAMLQIIAEWIINGGKMLNKDTHFQERDGKY
ncbi:MAG: NAD(P)-dependent oxidoreductase [Chitinophagaceae bacterium]|nr:NAD(P)-dependent oxidoreductase [Chitinophagaceae bacterium]